MQEKTGYVGECIIQIYQNIAQFCLLMITRMLSLQYRTKWMYQQDSTATSEQAPATSK